MSIRTYKNTTDLCLVKFSDRFYIGYIELPQKEWTIEQYNKWCSKSTNNLIDVTGDYTPQTITNNSLSIIWTHLDLYEMYKNETKNEEPVPMNFKELLIALFNSKEPEVRFLHYIKEMFVK